MEVHGKQKENNNEGGSDGEFNQNGEVNYKITLEDLKKEKRRKPPPVSDDNDYKITLDDLKPKKLKTEDGSADTESPSSSSNGSSTKGERIKDVLIPTGEIDICACSAFHHTCGRANKPTASKVDTSSPDKSEVNKPAPAEKPEQPDTPQTKQTDMPLPETPPVKTLPVAAALSSLDGHFLFEGDGRDGPEGVPCAQCSFVAKTPKGLAKHSQVHRRESEGPYNCTVCKYQGKSKVYLARHMLLHADGGDGSPPLSCDQCPYTTRHPASMTRHRNSHEDQSELRKFQCDKCDYRAKRKDHLERHLFTHLRNDNEVLIP